MQVKRELDPHAKEFVPKSWITGREAQNVDTMCSVTAPTNVQWVTYRSALENTAAASSHEISRGTVVLERTEKVLNSFLDMEKLLQNRRLSKPKKSVLASQKKIWIDIAHKQAVCLNTTESSHVAPDSEGISFWHRVLSQSDSSTKASTRSLLHAEALHSQHPPVKITEDSARNEHHLHSTFDSWWHAVLYADYAAMSELIDQHRASWDCTYSNKICSETVRLEMTTLCASILFFSNQDRIADQSTEGLNALHICSLHSRHALCLEQFVQRDAVRVHLDCHERTHKRTALHFASWAGNLEAVKILIAYGADVTLKDRHGNNTALHFATRVNNLPIVTLLCEKSRKLVNMRNKASETPLLLAGSRSIAQVLITAGADVKSLNADGIDAATLAARAGHSSLLEALLNVNSSHRVNKTQVHANLSSSAVNSKQASQRTTSSSPLHQAAQHGHTACVKLLLNRCSSCSSNSTRFSPHSALPSGEHPGNNCNQMNTMHDCEMHVTHQPTNLTPLMHAALAGHADIFALLLLHGVNPAQETLIGCTALTLAAAAPTVSVDFLHRVFASLSEQQYPMEKLLTENTRRVSVLASIALEALKHHRSSQTTPLQELRLMVLQEYVLKFALLLACNAPLREDFVKLLADPVCTRYMQHFGVDLKLPVEEWRQFLQNAILPEEGKSSDEGLQDINGAMDSKEAVESLYGWLKHDYGSVLDPPLVTWSHADVRVILRNRRGEVTEERLCHSFMFRTERCGVLKTMVESPLAKREMIPEGEVNAGELRVVLSFPHVSVELFDALLQWVYTGRDVIYAEILLRSSKAPVVLLGTSRRGEWIEEWVQQRQSTAFFVLELLYLVNELLIHELQELCEMHLCDLHTALPDEEVQLLVKAVDCPLFGPFIASGHRVNPSQPTERHTAALYQVLQEATLTAPPLQLTLLRHGASVLQVFCDESDLCIPHCVTRIVHHITQTEQRVRQAYMADCKCFPGDEKQTEPIPAWMERCVKQLLFVMHSWIQRVSLHRKMTNYDVKIVIHSLFTTVDDANGCVANPDGTFEEKHFYAHGALLAQVSPKFASMIRFTKSQLVRPPLSGDNDCEQMLALPVQQTSAVVLESLLCYCYTGVLPSSLLTGDADVVQNLLLELVSVADQYLIPTLSALLVRLLIQRLNADNAVCFFETACLHQLGALATLSALLFLKQGTSGWIDGDVLERENIVNFYESILSYLLDPVGV